MAPSGKLDAFSRTSELLREVKTMSRIFFLLVRCSFLLKVVIGCQTKLIEKKEPFIFSYNQNNSESKNADSVNYQMEVNYPPLNR